MVWLFNIEEHTGRLSRWAALLSQFSLKFIHIKGTTNVVADDISRPSQQIKVFKTLNGGTSLSLQETEAFKLTVNSTDPYENSALQHYLKFGRHEPGSSTKTCARIVRLAKSFLMLGDDIYFIEKTRDTKIPR